MEKELWTCFKS